MIKPKPKLNSLPKLKSKLNSLPKPKPKPIPKPQNYLSEKQIYNIFTQYKYI